MHITTDHLKKLLVQKSLISEEKMNAAIEESKRSKVLLEEELIGKGYVQERYLTEALAAYLGVPLYSVENNKEAIYKDYFEIPESIAKERGVFLLKLENHEAHLAMLDPNNLAALNFLEKKLNASVKPYLISYSDFVELMKLYRQNITEEFKRIIQENIERLKKKSGKTEVLAKELPVITILDTILDHAVTNRASDIHIEQLTDHVVIRYRIDGLLHDVAELSPEMQPVLIARIKIISGLQIDEHLRPQDGRFKIHLEGEEIAVRVSVIPTLHGEKAALRLLASSRRPLNLPDLGLSDRNLKIVENAIKRTSGMVLVTGPTGSGKTTTLYTFINILNKPEVNITTIEDPIEYDILRVNQTQVNVKAGLTFAEALRSFLRQNPDIIMIGEIRDNETTELSVHAALTGHLVLSTLHTDDSPSAIPRLIDLGAEPFLLSSTLNTVVAQRLVRRICRDCIRSIPLSKETEKLIREQMVRSNKPKSKDIKIPEIIYRGKGCKVCNFSGYKGQIGIFEVLEVTRSITDLILKRVSTDVIRDEALKEGLVTLLEDGMAKVEAGITTVDEILRVVHT